MLQLLASLNITTVATEPRNLCCLHLASAMVTCLLTFPSQPLTLLHAGSVRQQGEEDHGEDAAEPGGGGAGEARPRTRSQPRARLQPPQPEPQPRPARQARQPRAQVRLSDARLSREVRIRGDKYFWQRTIFLDIY